MKKVAIVGICSNPPLSLNSHNAGWTYVNRSVLEQAGRQVHIATEKDDWSQFDELWICEGVNFKPGCWNLFGGVSDKIHTRLEKLCNYAGPVYTWGQEAPDYNDLCDKRDLDYVVTNNPVEFHTVFQSPNLIVGDSHSISVYEPGWEIKRFDGKTLWGFLKDGFSQYIEPRHTNIRLYAGNIDVRHHLCRLGTGQMINLFEALDKEVRGLVAQELEVEIVELLPIESEDRRIPKTGYYKKKPFYGSWEDRDAVRGLVNNAIEAVCQKHKATFLTWPDLTDALGELDQKFMESGSSVHLAPSSYMFQSAFVTSGPPARVAKKGLDVLAKSGPSFEVNFEVLDDIDEYDRKSRLMQKSLYEWGPPVSSIENEVGDDLVFNVPIYDVLDRRYAAFSSFLEALDKEEQDPKGNGVYFERPIMDEETWVLLFYLFRLCGSGINYKPKTGILDAPFGTHGFGNFWVVENIAQGDFEPKSWMESLKVRDRSFTDSKGYLLPMISYKDQVGDHLKRFILENGASVARAILEFAVPGSSPKTIVDSVENMNNWLQHRGFKRQNFVLSATMADIAEYLPHLVDPNSMIYAGTNAQKCIKAIFRKTRDTKTFEADCIQFLSDRYEAPPYSVEDSRLCDVVRYWQEFQSSHHTAQNNGRAYKNNSTLRKVYGELGYQQFVQNL